MAMASVFVYIALVVISTYHIVSGRDLLDLLHSLNDGSASDRAESQVAGSAAQPASNRNPVILIIGENLSKRLRQHKNSIPRQTPAPSSSSEEANLLSKDSLLKILQQHEHPKPRAIPPPPGSSSEEADFLSKLLSTRPQKAKKRVSKMNRIKKLLSPKNKYSHDVQNENGILYSPIVKNLLRISNKIQCRELKKCENSCKSKKCKIECEEVHDCIKPKPYIPNEESDDCDDCNKDNSCGDSDCPEVSTQGYHLEDEEKTCNRC